MKTILTAAFATLSIIHAVAQNLIANTNTTKPNIGKDLISCAEYLISKKYASPGKLAINGVLRVAFL